MAEKKHLSCVTCSAPLTIGPEGEVREPDYFACTSRGWTPEREGDRDAEDFDALCRHMMTVGSPIRDVFSLMDLGARKDLKHLNLGVLDDRQQHLEDLSSLCHLLRDLEAEAKRKVERLDQWICKELHAEEKRED